MVVLYVSFIIVIRRRKMAVKKEDSDCYNDEIYMSLCAGLLQVDGLPVQIQESILGRFCNLWQDQDAIEGDNQKSQTEKKFMKD